MKKKQKSVSTFKYGLRFLKKYKLKLIFAIFWSVIFVLIPMQVPIIIGTLVDGLNLNNNPDKTLLIYGIIDLGNSPQQIIFFSLVGLIGVAIIYGISSYLMISSRSIISRNFAFDLQKVLIQKLEFLSIDIHTRYGSGDLLNRVLIDINNVRPFVEATIIKLITNIVGLIYPLLMLFIIDLFLGAVASSILPILFLIIYGLQSKISKVSEQLRNDKAKLTMFMEENIDGIETIQTSNAEKFSIEKISNQIERVETAQVSSQRYYGLMMGFAWGLTGVGVALTWWLGGLSVLTGGITLGQLIIFTGFVLFVYTPIRRLTRIVKDHHRSLVAMRHIQEILETPSSIMEDEKAIDLGISQGSIKFQKVTFSYKKNKRHSIVNNITINIEPKSLTAIIGRSGSGKSSILKLICRLYDPTEGRILIDGTDIKNITIKSLRSQIAVVPQSYIIFNGTIRENIKFANPEASDIEVEQACMNADALKFINKFKKGLDTVVGQRGAQLSGGEAQRIAIARALLKKAKILLLDEPRSAVDPESAKSIMNTLHKLKKDMTIIIVDHNRETIGKIDNMIVMDSGKVVEEVQNGIMKRFDLDNDYSIVCSENYSNYIVCDNNDAYNTINSTTKNQPSKEEKIIKNVQNSDLLDYKMIGRSVQQRRINVVIIGEKFEPQLKILIMAGQHGDEIYGRKATGRLISYLLNTKGKEFGNICIAILPNVNPDGSYKQSRKTRLKIDMNRDHVLLKSEENRVIHHFIRTWQPNLIIDVHNYPSKRKYLNDKNYAFCKDILIDVPSNLSIYKRMEEDQLSKLINSVQSDLDYFGFSCDRYVIINEDGKVRHSTHDIVDARNFLSLRYNILTILLESKEPLSKKKKKEEERSIFSQYIALLSLLKWAKNNAVFLVENSHAITHKKGDLIPIQVEYVHSEKPFKMNFENSLTKNIEEVAFPRYDSHIKAKLYVRLPYAYAVPIDRCYIIDILHQQGFRSERISYSKLYSIERYSILLNDGNTADISAITKKEEKDLYNYEVFPTYQEGGQAIALLLEPQSEYGLHRYENSNLELAAGTEYPILRVL